MGAEVPALIVLLAISFLLNIGFIGYMLLGRKNKSSSSQYTKVDNPNAESLLKNQQKSSENHDVVASNNTVNPNNLGSRSKEKLDAAEPKVQRSEEHDLRSEHGVTHETQQRSDRQRLQEPVSGVEFMKYMSAVILFINEYFDESHKQPVVPENDVSTSRLQVRIPEKPEECSEILKDVKEVIVPNICHTQHPRYHAQFFGKSLADVIGSAISSALGHDKPSPVIGVIERLLCEWMRTALGLPQMRKEFVENQTVILQDPTGIVLYSPRDTYLAVIQNAYSKYKPQKKQNAFVVYSSDDAHLSLEEACKIAQVKLRKVITSEKDSAAMTVQNLKKQIDKDVARGFTPLVVIANYGSSNVAANDEIWDFVKLSRQMGIWLHLDAAYAGCEWLDVNSRNNVHALISEANSIHVTFSSLFPFSGHLTILWSGMKLDFEQREHQNGENSIRLWILIRLYGMRSIREAAKRKIMLGNAFSERLSHHHEFFKIHYANEHGITIFQYENKRISNKIEDENKSTSMFHNYLISTSTLKFSIFRFHKKVFMKAVINYERSTLSMVEESVSTLVNSAEEFEEEIKKKKKTLDETSRLEYSDLIGGSPNETTDETQSGET
ncbi:unnamed protein product [Caenorhabditis sp. 36 PRJEB53466]|nr:unnamed protein product [Caenorhabditis sp. 36 PRJEB53466]